MAYKHLLSKRTSLFAAYGKLSAAALGTASLFVDLRPVSGGSSSTTAAGVRHSF
jgi:predicted porin